MPSILRTILVSSILICAMHPAQAAFKLIYEVLGVYDFANMGTSFHCSNVTQNPVNVQVRVFGPSGAAAGTPLTRSVPAGGTVTVSTRLTLVFGEAGSLGTGSVSQGRARIFTEVPTAILCAADWVEADSITPAFVAPRRMIRYPRGTSGGED